MWSVGVSFIFSIGFLLQQEQHIWSRISMCVYVCVACWWSFPSLPNCFEFLAYIGIPPCRVAKMLTIPFRGFSSKPKDRVLWTIVELNLIWTIRWERNVRILRMFRDALWELLYSYSSLWAFINEAFTSIPLSLRFLDWHLACRFKTLAEKLSHVWSPPLEGIRLLVPIFVEISIWSIVFKDLGSSSIVFRLILVRKRDTLHASKVESKYGRVDGRKFI